MYLPTFTIKINPNVGKYTIHGLYGSLKLMFFFGGSYNIVNSILRFDKDPIVNQ